MKEFEGKSILETVDMLLSFMPEMPPDEAATAKVAVALLGGALTDLNRIACALETIAANTAPTNVAVKPDDEWVIYHAGKYPEERVNMPDTTKYVDCILRDGSTINNKLASNLAWGFALDTTITRWRYSK